jgi:CMP-N,N'-diacetyllegionaminic acid synthase
VGEAVNATLKKATGESLRLCTICARGGSKGVQNKNLLMVNGRSLIEISVTQALKSGLFDKVVVSSDSEEILAAGTSSGAHLALERPAELATDQAGKIPTIQHAARESEAFFKAAFTTFVDLDATSPLRLIEDIVGAVGLLESSGSSNVVTGSPARRSPYFNLLEENSSGFVGVAKKSATPVLRRQDAPKCFDMNASIYVWKREALLSAAGLWYPDTRIFEMPEERSLDIDSNYDLEVIRFVAEKYRRFENEW